MLLFVHARSCYGMVPVLYYSDLSTFFCCHAILLAGQMRFFCRYSYKNGSLTRQEVRDRCAKGQWEEFDRLLDSTRPGNDGNIGKSHQSLVLQR